MWCVSKEVSRSRREILHGFREIVCDWFLSPLLPQKLLSWQAGFVTIISRWGVQMWPRPCERSKEVSPLWPYYWADDWDISRIRLLGQSVLALILSPRTVPKVSAYRPDYLFQTVIDVWGGHPNRSRLSKDLQDGPLIIALGNGPKQDWAC